MIKRFVFLNRGFTVSAVALVILWILLIIGLVGQRNSTPHFILDVPKPLFDSLNFSVVDNSPEFDENFLFFNRVPKTGSENFVYMLKQLADANGFTHKRSAKTDLRWRFISENEQVGF